MTQAQLEHAVATTTGESLITVRNLGFRLHRPRWNASEPRDLCLALDCPFCDRPVPYPGRACDGAPAMAECARCDVFFDFEVDEVYATRSVMTTTSR